MDGVKLEFKEIDGKRFLKVFHHNSSSGSFFSSLEESSYFVSSAVPTRFSILNQMNSIPRFSSDFEFILEYPEFSEYMHWSQNVSPLDYTESNILTDDIGLECYYCPFSRFKGLMRSEQTAYNLLDGDSIYLYYYQYSIGALVPFQGHKYPGPVVSSQGTLVYYSALWLRIPFIAPNNSILGTNKQKLFNQILTLLILIERSYLI